GRVPADRTDPTSPRLPGQINLETRVMVIVERAGPEQAAALSFRGGSQKVCCHGAQINPVPDLGPLDPVPRDGHTPGDRRFHAHECSLQRLAAKPAKLGSASFACGIALAAKLKTPRVLRFCG